MLGAIILMPWLITPDHLQVGQTEIALAQHLGGNPKQVTKNADATFNAWFVQTGAVETTREIAAKSMNVVIVNPQQYYIGFWSLLYRAIWRVDAFGWAYFYGLIAVVIPMMFDGIMVRMRKYYSFGYQNPAYFHGATHLALFFIGLTFFIPFAPFALTEATLIASVFLIAFALWAAAANTQTGGA